LRASDRAKTKTREGIARMTSTDTHGRKPRLMARVAPLLGLAVLLTAACAPGGPRPVQPEGQSSAPAGTQKTLRIGITADAEPKEGGIPYSSAAGGFEPAYLLHAGLSVYDEQGAVQPRLAERVPTLENGDWAVTPDGRMELTWKLRPDAKWHDGTPLTGTDAAFGYRVSMDPRSE